MDLTLRPTQITSSLHHSIASIRNAVGPEALGTIFRGILRISAPEEDVGWFTAPEELLYKRMSNYKWLHFLARH